MNLPHPSSAVTRASGLIASLTLIAAGFGVASAPASARVPADQCAGRTAAHRTDPYEAPENTIPGIRAAARTGAGWVEMDVRWTNSGYPMLMHDNTIDRTTNGTGTIESMGLSQASTYSAADYAPWNTTPGIGGFANGKPITPIPYAGDFLHEVAVGGLRPILDISGEPTEVGMSKLATYLDREGLRGGTLIMSNEARVRKMQAWQPNFAYGVLEWPSPDAIRSIDSIRNLHLAWYLVPVQYSTRENVEYWKKSGAHIGAWSSDSPQWDTRDERLTTWSNDVDLLISNYPQQALAECKNGG